MTYEDLLKLKEDTEWPRPGTGEPTAFQNSILENKVSELPSRKLGGSNGRVWPNPVP